MPFASLTIAETDSDTDAARVTDILVTHNRQFTAAAARLPLRLVVRDKAGTVQGGALGYSIHGWCYVDILALAPETRGHGMGARLLAAVEQTARARGCVGLYLFSYSFQAPGFYERQGFTAFGRIDDLPPGHAQVWLSKRL